MERDQKTHRKCQLQAGKVSDMRTVFQAKHYITDKHHTYSVATSAMDIEGDATY